MSLGPEIQAVLRVGAMSRKAPVRVSQERIVEVIGEVGGCCEEDLAEFLDVHPITLRRHLEGLVLQRRVERLPGRTRPLDRYAVPS